MTQREYVGYDSIKSLEVMLKEFSSETILLVTGKSSYVICSASKTLKDILGDYRVERYCDFPSTLHVNEIYQGIDFFKKIKPDTIIAVGGGSVIDAAKLINFFGTNGLDPRVYFKRNPKITLKKLPLIAIPTTAGSGSEATHFAVLFDLKTKYSVGHECILPDVSIVDPTFTRSLPSYQNP